MKKASWWRYLMGATLLVMSMTSGTILAQGGKNSPGLGDVPPMKIGQLQPAMDFATFSDNKHPSWKELEGKVVVVDFWATWCPPCIAAIPKMNALAKEFTGQHVVFYSITYETPGMIGPFLKDHPLETKVGLDNDFRTFKSFNAWAIPVVYVFDASGRLAAEVNAAQLDASLIRTVMAGELPQVPQQMAWNDPTGAENYFRSLLPKGQEPKK